MKKYILIIGLIFSVAISACNSNKKPVAVAENEEYIAKQVAQAVLNSTSTDSKIGELKFYSLADGKIKMDLTLDFPERADSTVAVHFHEHGDCGNMGENAHGHWNPTNEKHGKWGSETYHSGDIGNIKLDGKGKATLTLTTDRWNVTANDVNNIIGRGVIVHGGTDDYVTQPTGNSGPRIGCGVITAN